MPKPRRSTAKPPRKAVKSSPAKADPTGGATLGPNQLLELRQLIRLVQRTGIGELEVSSGGRTVRISAHSTPGNWVAAPVAAPAGGRAQDRSSGSERADSAPAAKSTDHLQAITSPMVGTFYRAPAPDADPYIEAGDTVETGQTVCIVEAMKLMNEIESEVRGRIVQILVENAQPVEFGQKLFLVEPV